MSRTLAHHAFAGVTEDGLNDFMKAFFTARPRYLHYGSPPFVTSTTASATLLPALAAPPLISPGIPYDVQLAMPKLDLFPADAPLPPPLSLAAQQFAVSTRLHLTVMCGAGKDGPGTKLALDLQVAAVGHLVSPGGSVGFAVDAVEVGPIQPPALQSIIECVLLEVIHGALGSVSIPIPALSAGLLTVTLEQGPQIDSDEIDIWGNV